MDHIQPKDFIELLLKRKDVPPQCNLILEQSVYNELRNGNFETVDEYIELFLQEDWDHEIMIEFLKATKGHRGVLKKWPKLYDITKIILTQDYQSDTKADSYLLSIIG